MNKCKTIPLSTANDEIELTNWTKIIFDVDEYKNNIVEINI